MQTSTNSTRNIAKGYDLSEKLFSDYQLGWFRVLPWMICLPNSIHRHSNIVVRIRIFAAAQVSVLNKGKE